MSSQNTKAFTLIELSIVLVIIGLIVGGVLVGRDLIASAVVRAQISQIEKYQQAVNTFKGKYNGYLPGDIPNPDASNFGFQPRGTYPGQGDGNAALEWYFSVLSSAGGGNAYSGEQGTFWVDLSRAKLIAGTFNVSSPTYESLGGGPPAGILPEASIGNNNYIGVYSQSGVNYFYISVITGTNGGAQMIAAPGLTVSQAFNIDSKIDDGLPQKGNININYLNCCSVYAASASAASPSSSTCYDTTTGKYSLSQNNGNGVNCALSFKLQ